MLKNKNNKFNKKTIAVSVMMGCVLLSGCTASRNSAKDYKTTYDASHRYADSAANVAPADLFTKSDNFYVDQTPIKTVGLDDEAAKLPPVFLQNAPMNIQTPTSLTELLPRIAKLAKMEVKVQQDVLDGTAGGIGQMLSSAPAAAATASPSAMPTMPGGGSTSSAGNPSESFVLNDVVYTGNLAGLLDFITGKMNLSWRWDGQEIQIYRYETKMYKLNALAGTSTVTTSLNTSSSNSSSGGSSSTQSDSNQDSSSGQNTQTTSTTSIWQDVGEALRASLSPKGVMSMVPSAGTITVKDTPTVLRNIEAQIKEYNRIYSKQVLLDIKVYQVESTDSDNYGIDWNSVWSWAGGKYGFSVASTSGLSNTSGTTFKLTGSGLGSLTNGDAALQALSTVGKASLVTSGQVISLNGQTVPLNASREVAYLQSSSTTVSGDSGVSSSTLTPGLVTEGFVMNFTPRVTDGNNIIMRYSVDLSTIEQITTYETSDGSSSIQLPQRQVRNFMQNVSMKSGETLVLTGFQQVQGNDSSSGVGSAKAWFFGGKKATTSTNRTIVIIVTPYITQ